MVGAGDGLPCGLAGTTCVRSSAAQVFLFENHLTNPVNTRLEDLTIVNVGSGYRAAIGITAAAGETISPVIENNTLTSNRWGINLSAAYGSASPTITNNNITGCTRGMEVGVWYGASVSPTITNNTITGGEYGIQAEFSSSASGALDISHNTISNYSRAGIQVANYGSAISLTVDNNTITTSGSYLIDIFAGSGAAAAGTPMITNNVLNDGWYGISFGVSDSSFSPVINNNTITGNGFIGIDITAWSAGTCSPVITNNTITGNGYQGINISAGGDATVAATVSNNTITGNGWNGFKLVAETSGTFSAALSNNTITGNSDHGVYLNASSPVTVDLDLGGGGALGHNTIRDNADSGTDGSPYDNPGYYDFYNDDQTGGGPIPVENNWWGATPPNIDSGSPEHIHNASGSVDADPANDQALSFSIAPLSGLAGRQVTITAAAGSFFVDEVGADSDPNYNIVVTIGGAPATGVSVNAAGTEITATMPAGSGSADVTVTNPGGQTGTLGGGFTYQTLVINEVMYDPAGDEPTGEWVELYVASGGVDLGGYRIIDQDGYSITLPSFTPQTGEYIVVHTGSGVEDLIGPVYHIYRGYGSSMWSNTADDATVENGSGDCIDYMTYGSGGSYDPPPAGCSWGAGTNPSSSSEGTSVALSENGQDVDSPSDWTESGKDGAMGPHSEGMDNNSIQGRSGSESCAECTVPLPIGFPEYLIGSDLYRDYVTIWNRSVSAQTLPIWAQLVSLTAGASAAVPPAIGTGLPGGTYWEYSDADYHSPGVSGTTFPAGAKISKRWDIIPDGKYFEFWVDLYYGSKGDQPPGRFFMNAAPKDRALVPKGAGIGTVLDDGTVELHVGSLDGTCVLANRFALLSATSLEEVSFYTSGSAVGELAEVIVYEDLTGEAAVPDSLMEVWRTTVELGDGGFQSVPTGGCPTLNPAGIPGAALFVAVAERAEGSYSVGIDLDGPYAGSSYVSTDGGLTYKPTSELPIIDGNAMIRVKEMQEPPCFLGSVK